MQTKRPGVTMGPCFYAEELIMEYPNQTVAFIAGIQLVHLFDVGNILPDIVVLRIQRRKVLCDPPDRVARLHCIGGKRLVPPPDIEKERALTLSLALSHTGQGTWGPNPALWSPFKIRNFSIWPKTNAVVMSPYKDVQECGRQGIYK